jgi:hypothetical protein
MAKYGKKSQEKVKEVMDEMKEGKLRSGRSGKKVTNRKQAIAIGLSEARKEGDKVPPPKKKGAKKAASKKSASKSSSKKSASKKGASKSAKKAAPKKAASKKKGAKKAAKKSSSKKR